MTLIGPGSERWGLTFIADHPSADAFVAMLREPDCRRAVRRRRAAAAVSRLIRMRAGAPGPRFGEAAG